MLILSRPSETLHVPTCDGTAIIDRTIQLKVGDTIYFEAFGICQLGLLGRDYIICEDGDTFEADSLKDITVIGVQTWELYR